MSRLRPKTTSPPRAPLYSRSKGKVHDAERKENTYVGAKADSRGGSGGAVGAPRALESSAGGGGARYGGDDAPKPRDAKRRQVLALRKPNSSKTHIQVASKTKSRRSVDGSESPRTVLAKIGSKRSFRRARCLPPAADAAPAAGWEDARAPPPGKRRVPGFAPPAQHLKKIRLKTGL